MNAIEYQKSLSKELEIVKNRVRSLIGSRHWGEEGRFKEAVLKNMLRKVLPKNRSVGTGFIVNSNDSTQLSKQIDIIVYDSDLPVLFSEGDFIITTMENVKAVVEVKSSIGNGNNTLNRVVEDFNLCINPIVGQFDIGNVFFGIFAYECSVANLVQCVERSGVSAGGVINHLALGKDYFVRRWGGGQSERLGVQNYSGNDFYNVYRMNNLSYSYFISNLIHQVCGGLRNRSWFSFPIEGTKEINREGTVFCQEGD
ncbi:DUF6602 domain-containing protein [Desulfovibrio sp. UCD-KL4C]|uniref:DUF6602 domain-containing protein n=1 Tax=Desulfovibrio sp. UCD-KL4C TaxID=2578120 RepID=UPI0025BA21A3|nr:DUF6602 domain-containing protein [Desulfovibrio sp. UCD-KL4C]